ncbi:MAG: hypothetical protein AAF989_08525 [Planctomycetota bacterium]
MKQMTAWTGRGIQQWLISSVFHVLDNRRIICGDQRSTDNV